MKRVCCFCETWESGGIESILTNLLLHMDRSELEIDIVAVCLKESIFTDKLKAVGIHFYQLSGEFHNLSQNYSLFRRLLQERRYDILHLNAFHSLSFFYLLIAKQVGIPKRIAHSHNTALRKSKGRFLKLWIHKASRFFLTGYATDLWACSGDAAKFLFSKRILERKGYQFIPNGIDTERFRFNLEVREQIRKKLHCDDKLVIGNVGRLCYQKNQGFLLDIFVKVHEKNSNGMLLLVGEGEDKQMLEEKAKRLGIRDAVLFYGTCRQMEKLYWAMDIFVFPSRFEGLPVTVVEAQTSGLSVVGTDTALQEFAVTDSVMKMSLSNSADSWADRILEAEKNDRSSFAGMVKNAGFDITDIAQFMTEYFIEEGAPKCQHQNI